MVATLASSSGPLPPSIPSVHVPPRVLFVPIMFYSFPLLLYLLLQLPLLTAFILSLHFFLTIHRVSLKAPSGGHSTQTNNEARKSDSTSVRKKFIVLGVLAVAEETIHEDYEPLKNTETVLAQ